MVNSNLDWVKVATALTLIQIAVFIMIAAANAGASNWRGVMYSLLAGAITGVALL